MSIKSVTLHNLFDNAITFFYKKSRQRIIDYADDFFEIVVN